MASDAEGATAASRDLAACPYPSLELAECPYPYFEFLHAEAPVHKVPATGEYLVSRHADVVHVLRRPEVFSSALARGSGGGLADGPGSNASTIASDPPEHRVKRALTSRGFKPRRLRAYEPTVERIADELIDAFADKGEVEFVAEFANPLPILVFCELFFGDPHTDFERFQRWALLEGSGSRYLPPDRREAAEQRKEGMGEYLEATIRDRYEHPRDDVLSEIVAAQVERDGELNVAYLRAEAGLLLAGGFVTTAHMMASAMLLMLEHPEQAAKVRADHSRIPRMLEEALRAEAPVQWQQRVARTDTEVGGVPIPAGSKLVVLLAAGNRDEARFADAGGIDFERANVNDHVAFGYGAHFCLGAPLGRLEGRIAFERLLTRLGDIRLAEGRNDLTHLESPLFRGVKALHLEFDPA